MSQTCLKLENVSKRFRILQSETTVLRLIKNLLSGRSLRKEFWALKDISFEIKKGEKVALIGKNGSGKTTLLRIISGIYDKTSGQIETNDAPRALFKFCTGLNTHLFIIDNIYLFGALHGMEKKFLKERLEEIIGMAEIGHLRYAPLKDLSAGQTQRLAMSAFFQVTGDFYIFDESLAFVDSSFIHKCKNYFDRLFSSSKTVIMASHDSSFLKKYCNRALWFKEGILHMDGPAREVIELYERS